MKADHIYDPKVVTWEHKEAPQFIGKFTMTGLEYGLGISQRDPHNPDFCYFNVALKKRVIHENKQVLFYGFIEYTFLVKVSNEIPTPEFYFDLISSATESFSNYFYDKMDKTNLMHHKIESPVYSELKFPIQKTIDAWKKEQEFGLN